MSTHSPDLPGDTDVAELSREELVRLGMKLDGVEVQHESDRWPVKGTRAERRAERGVAAWFLLAGLGTLAFLGVFLFWPWEYQPAGSDEHVVYLLYTPLVGLTLGIAVFAVGAGVIAYAKKFLPDEVSVQQRHDGPSAEVDRRTMAAQLAHAGTTSGIARRSLIKRSAGFGLGVMGLGVGVLALGGLIKNPWKGGDKAALWTTGWAPATPGEKVYLRRDTGHPTDIALVRPEDLAAGAMETVFPFRESERDDEEALIRGLRRADSPVMLIRLRPGTPTVQRAGYENYNYGDYWAYSKICTHLGCPTSLFEQQTNRILCPCHQSQFDATQYGKPIFGPATRALPLLPLDVDDEGYFVARSDFGEAVGPGFWERRS
ncbi:MAG TPA: ubiquinol-cytochrome c reductase iron-sulfur subunit [Pseudonocardiaceae bacterium]